MKGKVLQGARYRPSIVAAPFSRDPNGGDGAEVELLSVTEQDSLIAIARLINVRKHTALYAEGGDAQYVYNIVSGVAETYQVLPNGDKRVTAFLFPRDLLGLAENGAYVATAQALTPLVAFKIPVSSLTAILKRDPELDIGLLCKLCHELRRAQHHAITVSKNEAAARIASFLLWLGRAYSGPLASGEELVLPMARHDIADYLGLSVESVSRALHQLEQQGAILRRGPRVIALLDSALLSRFSGQD